MFEMARLGTSLLLCAIFLTVVGVGAVFAGVVFVEDVGGDGGGRGVEGEGVDGHLGADFEGGAVVETGGGSFAPSEGGVVGKEDGGGFEGVEVEFAETFDNADAGVEFVVGFDFFRSERAGEGDGAEEMVGMGGA